MPLVVCNLVLRGLRKCGLQVSDKQLPAPRVTLLGCCRQESIISIGFINCTDLHQRITYPHYSKEVIEMIKFCQDGHILPEESRFVFRTAILSGQAVESDRCVREMFSNTDIFVIEIASKLEYRYKNRYVHHVAIDPDFNVPSTIRSEITVQKQSYESLERDILEIRSLLAPKRFFIVTHYSSYDRGERHQLVQWLEEIGRVHNIRVLNPKKRLKGQQVDSLFEKETVLTHYSQLGHKLIRNVYRWEILKQCLR